MREWGRILGSFGSREMDGRGTRDSEEEKRLTSVARLAVLVMAEGVTDKQEQAVDTEVGSSDETKYGNGSVSMLWPSG